MQFYVIIYWQLLYVKRKYKQEGEYQMIETQLYEVKQTWSLDWTYETM